MGLFNGLAEKAKRVKNSLYLLGTVPMLMAALSLGGPNEANAQSGDPGLSGGNTGPLPEQTDGMFNGNTAVEESAVDLTQGIVERSAALKSRPSVMNVDDGSSANDERSLSAPYLSDQGYITYSNAYLSVRMIAERIPTKAQELPNDVPDFLSRGNYGIADRANVQLRFDATEMKKNVNHFHGTLYVGAEYFGAPPLQAIARDDDDATHGIVGVELGFNRTISILDGSKPTYAQDPGTGFMFGIGGYAEYRGSVQADGNVQQLETGLSGKIGLASYDKDGNNFQIYAEAEGSVNAYGDGYLSQDATLEPRSRAFDDPDIFLNEEKSRIQRSTTLNVGFEFNSRAIGFSIKGGRILEDSLNLSQDRERREVQGRGNYYDDRRPPFRLQAAFTFGL